MKKKSILGALRAILLGGGMLLAADPVQADNTGTGGTITYTDASGLNPVASPPYPGGYVVHTFTSSGTLAIPSAATADVLIVGGGGGGGHSFGAGGGAGGMITASGVSLGASSYPVVVGAGGAGAGSGGAGAKGVNSSIAGYTANGGGGGGGNSGSAAAGSGGSGGGGSLSGPGGAATPAGQGNTGGTGGASSAGGGGGAGQVGQPGQGGTVSGRGGDGLSSAIEGTTKFYAQGGCGFWSNPVNNAGKGGGGNAVSGQAAQSGVANTGGGGGGFTGTGAAAGNGGSGIVVVRYPYSATVTFDNNTGTGSMAAQTSAVAAALTANTFTKTGYTFAGWNTLANGTGTVYADGASYAFTASTTLYAQWTTNTTTYTVTFDNNTGTGSMAAQTSAVAAVLTANTFTKTGYTFAGWNTASGGGGTSYADGASYPFTADTTLYAQWTIISYTVTFNNNTGTGTMTAQTGNYNTTAALTANSFTKTGYTFAGWNTASGGGGTSYADSANYTFTASTTLYAQWTINTYTLTYTAGSNGSLTGTTSQTVNYNTSGSAVTAVPATGYYFMNWSDSSTANPRTDASVAANVNVTANFAIIVLYDNFATNPNITTQWTTYNYHNVPTAPVWDSTDKDLDLVDRTALYRTGATRAATDPVTMTVKALNRSGGTWGFLGLMISAVAQPKYVDTADDTYTLRMQPTGSGATTFHFQVTRTYLDGTGNFILYQSPAPITFAGPYTLDITRVGDHYVFKANGTTLYTTTGTGADFYTPTAKNAMVYYQVVMAGDSGMTATIDDFGILAPPIDVPFAGTINDGPSTDIRLSGGTYTGTSADNVLLGSATTTVSNIFQAQTNPTTIDNASQVLRLGAAGGVAMTSGVASLTIGTAANSGTLTAGGADNTAGTVNLTNNDATALLTVNSVIANNGSGAVGVTTAGAGTSRLSGTNTYTGITTITSGVLEATSLANGGTPSGIGQSTNAAANLVFGAPTATLRYTGGSNVVIDRGFTLSSGVGGGATIESSGAGTLSFDNTVALAYGTTAQTRTLTLGGTNTGANTFGKVIANNGAGLTSLVKTGVGTWVLDQANTYTGATTVNGGTLSLGTTGNIASSAVTVSGTGATLAGGTNTAWVTALDDLSDNGGRVGNVTVNTSGSLMPGGATTAGGLDVGTLTLGTSGTGTLQVDLTGAGGRDNAFSNYDMVIATGAVDLANAVLSVNPASLTGSPSGIYFLVKTLSTLTGTFSGASYQEGQSFTVGGQSFKITYVANHDGDSFTGGNDIAIQKAGQTYADWAGIAPGYAIGGAGTENQDFDKDGLSNLMEYLLGRDPTVDSNPEAITYQLKGTATTNDPTDPTSKNQIVFTRPGAANTNFPSESGIVYKGQVSDDAISWTDLPITSPEFVVTNGGTATETVTITDTTLIGASSTGKRFIRLFVEK